MSLVDPFIPSQKPGARTALSQKPKPQLVNNITPYVERQQPVTRHQAPAKPQVSAATQTQAVPVTRASHAQPAQVSAKSVPRPARPYAAPIQPHEEKHRIQSKKIRRALSILHLVLGTAGIMGLGLFLPSLIIGELCIAAYALVTLVFRIPSNAIFALAATSLLGILVAQQFQDYSPVATVAIYTFMLLTVGALALIRETLRRNKVEA